MKLSVLTVVICLWFISQLFIYSNMGNLFTFDLLVTLTPDRILFLIIVSIFIINIIRRKNNRLHLGKIEILMLIFALYCSISLWVSGADIGLERKRWQSTLFNLAYYPFITYIISKNYEFKRKEIVAILTTLSIIGVYLAFTGIFEHYKMNDLIYPKYIMDTTVGIQWGRSRGPFGSASTMGKMLIMCFIATMLLINGSGLLKKLFLFLELLLISMSIYFTETRSIWIIFGVTLIIMVFMSKSLRKPTFIIVAILIMGTIIGAGSKLSIWESSLFSRRQETIDYRKVNYYTDIEMIKDNTFWGIGYGKFTSEWPKYFNKTGIKLTHDIKTLNDGNHNTFLGLLAEIGVVGFSIFILIYLNIFKDCLKALKKINDSQQNDKGLIVATISMIVAYFIEGQFVDLRFQQVYPTVMFLFIGISSYIANSGRLIDKQVRVANDHTRYNIQTTVTTLKMVQ